MTTKHQINDNWINAAMVGTIWAASEIVFGSFLHNLKVPFSGNILTAIGIVVLISAGFRFKTKGLFWRAGLICAIMKTISPSAVIFGPMVAIFTQSLLLELSVRLVGKNYFGYIMGGVLAMSWNLVQKILTTILMYGSNIIELYKSLIKFTEKQLGLQFDVLWLPILFLLLAYVIFGFLAALIGIKAGQRLLKEKSIDATAPLNSKNQNIFNNKSFPFNYSLFWLFLDVTFVIVGLIILSKMSALIAFISIAVVIFIFSLRYKKALKQLLKPMFWLFFVLITMLTALLFSKLHGTSISDGLLIGLQMNFRAALIIVGFSVIGTELYNPKIRLFFQKTYFKQLPLALELSFNSLPSIIKHMPDFKSALKNPVSIINSSLFEAEQRFSDLRKNLNKKQHVFIITGGQGKGKTTFLKKIITVLRANHINLGGFYSHKIIENEIVMGYDVVGLADNQRAVFLRRSNDEELESLCKYKIFKEGLEKSKYFLSIEHNKNNDLIIIDEVGYLELENKGLSSAIDILLGLTNKHIVMVVRSTLIESIIDKWKFGSYSIFDISKTPYTDAIKGILGVLKEE